MSNKPIIYVDVDDTFVRSAGSKRMPIPRTITQIRRLKAQGAELYCWSSGGGDYARASAEEFGIADCFVAFLPKPHILLDDMEITAWPRLACVHPNQCETILEGEGVSRLESGPPMGGPSKTI